jgi:hypothetical protein
MLYRNEQRGMRSRLGQGAQWGLIGVLMLLGVAGSRGGTPGTSIAVVEGFTLDQSFTSPDGLAADINDCCRFIAQTFTAGLTGTLGGVNIDVGSSSILPLHVDIRTVMDGVPSTTVLGETTLSSSSAPLSLLISFPQVIHISAGVQYAIVVNYEGAPPPSPVNFQGFWGGAGGDPYPGGASYASFLDGTSWVDEEAGLLMVDLHFQTYVNPIIQVAIDIKPGSDTNPINPRSNGKIPVAVLTMDTLDATTVNAATVRFGANGTEAAPVLVSVEDVNDDGRPDLLLHFDTRETGIHCGETSASLIGETFDGQAIEGFDAIRAVGCKVFEASDGAGST